MLKSAIRAMVLAAAVMVQPLVASAEDLALIIANDSYDNLPGVDTRHILNLQGNLRQAGFDVELIRNMRGNMRVADAEALYDRIDRADRLVVVLAGHVVHVLGHAWLLNSDAVKPTAFTMGRVALQVDPFYGFAGRRAGDALIAVASPGDVPLTLGRGVEPGFVAGGIPQGVTVLHGPPGPLASFLAREVLQRGQSMADAAAKAPEGVEVLGYVPAMRAFLPAEGAGIDPALAEQLERLFWQQTVGKNTLDAYRAYLDRYPQGLFAKEARKRVADLRLTPQDRARLAELDLGLTRDQRRAIQRQLTLLGYDTEGVDGIFGRNTRRAIANWQRDAGLEPTGFLNANQMTRIRVEAQRKAKELQRQAEERRQAEAAADRAFWEQTGANGSVKGLRLYLREYPDGIYADRARNRLQALLDERRMQAETAERKAWDAATQADRIPAYRQYLQDYPDGLFADQARQRIEELRNPETPPEVIARAKAEEERIGLNPITRRLIESQLKSLEFDPGPVDGQFTRETRRALRRFQRASALPVTGYVTRDTIVRLLASSLE